MEMNMSKNTVTRFKKKANGQKVFDGSFSTVGRKAPTTGRMLKTGFGLAGLATTAFALTGCGSTTPVKPKVVKCVSTPPAGFASVTGTQMPRLLAPLPTITGDNLLSFGGADCAQTAFTYAFAFLYKANKIPDLWTPNLNKDANFIPNLEGDLQALAPYLGGSLKERFISAIPTLVNPIKDKASEATAGIWRGLFMIPDRLKNGTLPPPSTAATDVEAVAPWDLGAQVTQPVATAGTIPEFGKTQVLQLDFKWTSNLVFGTKTRIKSFAPLTRDMSVYVIANPDSWKDKAHPYLVVGYKINSNAAFGTASNYDKPLVAKAPN